MTNWRRQKGKARRWAALNERAPKLRQQLYGPTQVSVPTGGGASGQVDQLTGNRVPRDDLASRPSGA